MENFENFTIKSTDQKYIINFAKIIIANLESYDTSKDGIDIRDVFTKEFNGKNIYEFMEYYDNVIDFSNLSNYNDSIEEVVISQCDYDYDDDDDDDDDDEDDDNDD